MFVISLSWATWASGQLLATDNFESYTSNPVGQSGGSGDWIGTWGYNSQNGGGAFRDVQSKIDGIQTIGQFGNGSTAGQSVSRAFPACTNQLFINASFRGDFNANSTNAPNPRRLAFTVRSGNEASHFGSQRLSFFFAAGTTNFQWYDGADRITNAVNYTLGHVYDLGLTMNPVGRSYSFTISNRNNATWFTYSGNWTTGSDGDAIGSVAFFMRGPTGAGNDSFLDSVSVAAPDYTPPPPPILPIKEGALWRYFKGTSTPVQQGGNQWYDVDFNDSAWSGPAPSGFGFGDADDATVLSDMQNNYLSVFTRLAFAVADTSTITRLTLAADYDDGFVAYLNGVEVARRNMPAGPAMHDTAALGNRESSRSGQDSYTCNCEPEEKEFIAIDPGALVNGTNILAVSGHNISLGSSDLSLIVELYTNVTLVRGPYLQMPNQGRVSVLWRTAAFTDSHVDYGYDTNYIGGTVSDPGLKRIHELELPAFSPGTTVYYRVRSGGEVLVTSHFRAPKVPGQAFRLAIMSDYGSPSPNTVAVANQALLSDPDVLITCGDNVQMNSAPPGLFDSDWFGPLAGLLARVPMMTSVGNHDIRIAQGAWYLDAVSLPTNGPPGLAERNYSFDYGNVHFVMLDANAFMPDDSTAYTNAAQMRPAIISWLTNDLHQTTQTWKFVAYHQPPFTSQGYHNDAEVMKAHLPPIFERYGVNIAFQGHNHFYERINPINGVHYFTVGSGGFSIHGLSNQREFSAKIFRDKYDFLVIDIDGPRLHLRCIDQDGVEQDSYNLDLSHPFKMDGLLDSTNWVRAANGLNINAAIRGPYLYLATQDAGEGSDHFIYLNSSSAPMRSANWNKSGQLMQWSAYLADENGGGGAVPGFYSWFGPNNEMLTNPFAYRAVTSGLNNNGTNGNGVLEGTLNLLSHFGSFPTQLLLAAAPFETLDAGTLVSSAQVPPGNGNGDIDPHEFLVIATRDLALDLPTAHAGPDAFEEAGMWVPLDGSQSESPSGLPLSFSWMQLSGPPGEFIDMSSNLSAFRLTNQIDSVTSALLKLVVFDTRFESDDTTEITFTKMVDSDQDGLSDREELTGQDNILTIADPKGELSEPDNPDSDGDGMSDGDESLAGTNRNDNNSLFRILSGGLLGPEDITINWSTVSGRLYKIEYNVQLVSTGWHHLANFAATSTVTSIADTNTSNFAERYYRIGVQY